MLLERNSEPQESKVNHALSEKVPGTSLHSDSAFFGNQIEWRGTMIEPNWIAFSVSLSFTTGSRLKLCFLPRLMMQTSSWSMQLWTSLQDAVLSIGWIPLTWNNNTPSRCQCSFIVTLEFLAHILYIIPKILYSPLQWCLKLHSLKSQFSMPPVTDTNPAQVTVDLLHFYQLWLKWWRCSWSEEK